MHFHGSCLKIQIFPHVLIAIIFFKYRWIHKYRSQMTKKKKKQQLIDLYST